MVFRNIIVYCIFIFLLTGCAHQLQSVDKNVEQTWLQFIEDGKTSKEEVILKLGQPTGNFEKERILTYKLNLDQNKGFVVAASEVAKYHLVLVFDNQNILQKHSLLKVK